jgi:predicted kinase
MAKICYILRGLPGTGKSMLAETLRDTLHPTWVKAGAIFSTDDLFMVDGEYQFDPAKLAEYHAKNLENATYFMYGHRNAEKAICVIDNTNTQHWEYANYVQAAKANDYIVQVITIDWDAKDIPLYAERNSHGVPVEAIYRMAARWER